MVCWKTGSQKLLQWVDTCGKSRSIRNRQGRNLNPYRRYWGKNQGKAEEGHASVVWMAREVRKHLGSVAGASQLLLQWQQVCLRPPPVQFLYEQGDAGVRSSRRWKASEATRSELLYKECLLAAVGRWCRDSGWATRIWQYSSERWDGKEYHLRWLANRSVPKWRNLRVCAKEAIFCSPWVKCGHSRSLDRNKWQYAWRIGCFDWERESLG